MTGRKFLKYILISLALFSLIFGGLNQTGAAMPMNPTDESKVPHYFGPYPNWANSQYTLPDASVEIQGDGTGAAAIATVGANGAVTGISITSPGFGYTAATVNIMSATGTGATADAVVSGSGVVTAITVDTPGSGYTAPVVTLVGGGAIMGNLKHVGSQLIERAYTTDSNTQVLVVLPTALPTGYLTDLMVLNQALGAGQVFNAYVLRPVAKDQPQLAVIDRPQSLVKGQYQVIFDSGALTMPALAGSKTSEVVTFSMGQVAIQAGDVLAFYGTVIPFDIGAVTDSISYNAQAAPAQGANITLDSLEYSQIPEARTYSVAAKVIDTSGSSIQVVATATAYGGVDQVILTDPGTGYSMPTVDFDFPDGPNGVQASGHVVCVEFNCNPAVPGDPVTITGVIVDQLGSGYSAPPNVVIRDGTIFDPILGGGTGAAAYATLFISEIKLDTFGSGYTSAPDVLITDPTGSGAAATATVDAGAVTTINLTAGGSGYLTQGGIKKFEDGLPVLCIPTANFSECATVANNLGQYIPIAVPDTTTFPDDPLTPQNEGADYYVIALVQHREQMNSSLPAAGTLLREYVQLETPANAAFSKGVALQTALLDGTTTPTLMPDGSQAVAVDDPHFLGPIIVAQKDRPVRVVFYNLLPDGEAGDLFLPVDSSMMGSGMGPMDGMVDPMDEGTVMDMVRNPMCSESPKAMDCFKDNRATVHLHGGISPWISDGTPHQWITPANEMTPWPEGVDVKSVPDMVGIPGVPDCSATNDGCMTFYYTNQQSARLLFYHDHSWGITRLNVYAGEAAGYIITDDTEQALFGPTGPYASMGEGIPLVIQDRTFVPDAAQLAAQDPTWDAARWGGDGNLWYHHVYMPAQNPGDPGGMSGYGRWMYGPWFWPPATPVHGPILNPYYNMDPNANPPFSQPLATPCNIDDPATWQYQTDPFCEPQYIPGTPNISVGMEQFNDTPIVNGTAYPTVTLDPKTYRFRILNAANDRFWNLQWYIADPTTGTDSEVALNPAELAAAQLDPVVFPTALKSIVYLGVTYDLSGPDWIQIGSEGGFLPTPVVIDGQQVTTWITDPTRFDVGNVDQHSLVLAPAERADVIVDFSQFAGKTLILYNDAPAAYPARVPSYDYYTGYPDQSPIGPSAILPGYGPNTRTIMQVKIADTTPDPAFNLNALNNAFAHKANGTGVFESGQNPIIVGQAAYNSAYGTNFAASSWCNAPGATIDRCDGFARISDQGGMDFGFNTLLSQSTRVTIPIEPKALHDEMNAVAFDEFGRMTANIGLEAVPANPGQQNVTLFPFVNPQTEFIDGTNLPRGDVKVTPISVMTDGTQIWKITHNGVDTHPIHWHLYDVQVLNRVTWDNIIIPPEANELGWKDTLRISPLEDTIVAIRAVVPIVPFEMPNSIRMLNPMMPAGSTAMFNNIDPQGNPTLPIVNQLVNFGWEYMFHCHILSHEEMDMMRPISLVMPPNAPDGLVWTVSRMGNNRTLNLTWDDNSINETEFVVQKSADGGTTWVDVGSVLSPLDQPNIHGTRSFDDTTFRWDGTTYFYRVVALNTAGYLDGTDPIDPRATFPELTAQSFSASVAVIAPPSNLVASVRAGPLIALGWMDNATNETGFIVERSTDGINFVQIGTAPARNNTGSVTYLDNTVSVGITYTYRVAAVVGVDMSPYSNLAVITVDIPLPPSVVLASAVRQGNNERVTLIWTDNSNNEANFRIERATNSSFTNPVVVTVPANQTTYTSGSIPRVNYWFRVIAVNVLGASAPANATPFPIPPAP
jgi:FtsP/CotA-like multicopper oxidase with cupredoxin domain